MVSIQQSDQADNKWYTVEVKWGILIENLTTFLIPKGNPPPAPPRPPYRGPAPSPLIDSSDHSGGVGRLCRHFLCREKNMDVSFAFLQTLNEVQFINILSWTILLLAFIVAICLIFLQVEYGRYFRSNSWQNRLSAVDGRIAWFVQELPAFVIPCVSLFYARKDALGLTPNTILLSLFVLHYSHR